MFRKDLVPLLFLIYVNELFKASNPLMEIMFAADANLLLLHKNIDALFPSLNVELENVSNKLSNKVYLNFDKTKWLLFHSQKSSYFHRSCLTFLLKIYISKENM